MVQVKYKSAGTSAVDAGTITASPNSLLTKSPAVIIGTSYKGPAFTPATFTNYNDFVERFGDPHITGSAYGSPDRLTDYGPIAVQEWLQNNGAATFIRVLGAGNGKEKNLSGEVTNAGFTVGEEQPNHLTFSGALGANPYANPGGILGRTYFLGAFMSESLGSAIFSSAGLQGTGSLNGIVNSAVPIVRGIIMAPSGVVLRLSSSGGGCDSSSPASTLTANDSTAKGTTLGSIKLFDVETGQRLQQFVLLLNGHKGTEKYPNVITASLDVQSPNYITRVLNLTASLTQQAGHYLAAHWDVYPTVAALTGTGIVNAGAEVADNFYRTYSTERSVFIITSSLGRDTGSAVVPNYESFRNRFTNALSPWIISQKFHGKPINLFRLHALDAGSNVSDQYKFIIDNILVSDVDSEYKYGTFDLTIRFFDDFEETNPPLEKFVNLSLNPSSPRYISKIIGDKHAYFDFDRPDNEQKIVVEGNYENFSRFVRVEVSKDVENELMPQEALPIGFRGMPHLITSGSSPLAALSGDDAAALATSTFLRNAVTPPVPLADNIIVYKDDVNFSASPTRHWGLKIDHVADLEQQNQIPALKNLSIKSFVKYYPDNATTNVNFAVSNNEGAIDTTQLGIIDADRFCNNLFTLENIKVVTGSNNVILTQDWSKARYVRNGVVQPNETEKSRRLEMMDFTNSNSPYLSFQFMLQGGFDGVNIFEKNEYNLSNIAATADMFDANRGRQNGSTIASYLSALKIAGNTSVLDMQVLAIPGIREPAITDIATEIVESRLDSIYIMDIEQVDSNDNPIEISTVAAYSKTQLPSIDRTITKFESRGINTTYAAAYFPDVMISVDVNKYGITSTQVPPSTVVLGAITLNDSLGQPWFAPAGTIRGLLQSTLSTTVKLNELDRDNLYSNNINPIWSSQNSSNVAIWGQKTISSTSAVVNRINVRRLLLEIRRRAKDIALTLLFDSNRNAIISRFNSRMNEELIKISSLLGVRDYRIDVNVKSTTQSDIENHTIRGRVIVQPKSTLAFVTLDFIVTNGIEPII